MGLVRVLENAVPLEKKRADSPPDEKNICGSASTHFKPDTKGRLSVFVAQTAAFERRIALAMAMSRRQVDDVVYCVLPDQVAEGLECEIESNAGALPLADVNLAHRDLVGVTLFCLGKLAIRGVESGVLRVEGRQLVTEILDGIDSGELKAEMLKDKLWENIVETRVYKRRQRKSSAT